MIHPEKFAGAKEVFDRLGMPPLAVRGAAKKDVPEDLGYEAIDAGCAENWLRYIMNSSFVFTDSFHGTAFSIIFRRPFVAVLDLEPDGKGRISTLLKALGLEDRFYPDIPSALASGALEKPIDFDRVHAKLEEKRAESLEWLRNALQMRARTL